MRIEVLTVLAFCSLVISLTWIGWYWWVLVPDTEVYGLARLITLLMVFIGATIGIGNWHASAEAEVKAKFKKESEIPK